MDRKLAEFVLRESPGLYMNFDIRDEIIEFVEDGEFEMCFELIADHLKKREQKRPCYPWASYFVPINAIDPKEEARKKEHNRLFKLEHGL